ncbi:MAG TPA: ABC transporter permease [Firmicutes bacterium]|jgi:ABC-type sugar transport system permease subunit|nr:ABC transporter permease [Bacillota bacterium]
MEQQKEILDKAKERLAQAGSKRRQKLSGEGKFAYWVIAPALVLVLGIIIFPLAVNFIYSLKNMELISAHRGEFVWFSNYIQVLSNQEFWAALGRTIYFTVVSLIIETVLGLLIALLLNERFFGVSFLRTIIILPWAIPEIVNGAMWRWIYNPEYGVLNAVLMKLHFISTYHSWLSDPLMAMNMVIIADAWKMIPLAVIFFLAALQMINKSSYEAAMVDGAGAFKRFFVLTMPYLKPTILVIIVMRTMEKFKAFGVFYSITRGGPADGTMVLTYTAFNKAFSNLQYSIAATYAYLIALVIVVLTVIYVKTLKNDGDLND